MSGHVTFEKMSDLYDGLIPSEEEKNEISRHIESCPLCYSEFSRLKKCLGLCLELKSSMASTLDFSGSVMRKALFRKRRKRLFRFGYAAAASVLIIFGVTVFSGRNDIERNLAKLETENAEQVKEVPEKGHTKSETVIGILRNHKADITRVTGEYVEGRIPVSGYIGLQKDLSGRGINFGFMDDYLVPQTGWGMGIEEVGAGQITRESSAPYHQPDGQYVRFRVYR
ncbi:MAG: hypothetical protein MUD12_09520 [Spirochaetes bacterium]|jgi:hypothetical protein|nr:hypothetical protein [Spirochaetota bacterium]